MVYLVLKNYGGLDLLAITTMGFAYIFFAAFITGFSKTSVGGMGILAVLLMALAIPGKGSPGVLLPMLIMADVFAVLYYRRDADWKILFKILPITAIGIIIGFFVVDFIPQVLFEKVLGTIIMTMLALSIILEKKQSQISKPNNIIFTVFVGIAAGISTMIANAAGPIFGVYFLQLGLPKKEFVGTRSWLFLILNIFKIPFSAGLGLISIESLKIDFMFLPAILLGAFVGYKVLKLINLEVFKWLIRTAVVIAAVRLLFF